MHVGRVWFDWWLFPIPNSQCDLAAIPFAADVGRVRGLDLFHGVGVVLVHGIDSGPGGDARSREDARFASSLMACSRWAGPARTAIGAITKRLT